MKNLEEYLTEKVIDGVTRFEMIATRTVTGEIRLMFQPEETKSVRIFSKVVGNTIVELSE